MLLLAACVEEPGILVHKAGSNAAERSAAIDRCEFAGINAVPRAMATQVSGGFYNPGTIQCSTIGSFTNCNRIGAVNIPPTATTIDANQDLRNRYTDRCLREAGYDLHPRPICRTAAERSAYAATLNNQPPASQIPCMIRRSS